MLDPNILITIVPPILTAVFAYLVAHKRNIITERINKAKVDADVQVQALTIVKGAMDDMREHFNSELATLKTENIALKKEIDDNTNRLVTLQQQLTASDELVETLRSEISTLKKTIAIYEDEISRLRKAS